MRHFALSLVSEPIMYLETNLLIDELCRRQIPTIFLASAPFSEKIRKLQSITHFYVSVDVTT